MQTFGYNATFMLVPKPAQRFCPAMHGNDIINVLQITVAGVKSPGGFPTVYILSLNRLLVSQPIRSQSF